MDILLIAGLWLDARAWDDVVPALVEAGHRPVPVALPGQGDGHRGATLGDQLMAVLAALDECEGPALVVGHSAASTLAWLAADRQPGRVARVALVGGVPTTGGERYAPFFEVTDGVMPFPGWEPFAGPDSADLSDEVKELVAANAHPVPEGVALGLAEYTDEGRKEVPVTIVCPEFSPEEARAWVEADVPELAGVAVDYVDIDSGHWPMYSRPVELARLLAALADR